MGDKKVDFNVDSGNFFYFYFCMDEVRRRALRPGTLRVHAHARNSEQRGTQLRCLAHLADVARRVPGAFGRREYPTSAKWDRSGPVTTAISHAQTVESTHKQNACRPHAHVRT